MGDGVTLAPVRGRDRIDVLDILRGIAILGIFYMNIPFMAGPVASLVGDFRQMGWSPADAATWSLIQVTWEGTQRGMLEFLFGAGLMVIAAKAMEPTGPVAIADLYIRRNLWLFAFGMLDVFALLWPGDILHIYGLAALLLFPFRKLSVRWLIPLGLLFATFSAVGGGFEYASRTQMHATYAVAQEREADGEKLTKAEQDAVKEWRKKEQDIATGGEFGQKIAKDEKKARSGSMLDYASFMWQSWIMIAGKGGLLFGVFEAFCAMLLGIALWKLGVIQGKRTAREYLVMMVVAYAFGMGARYLGVTERLAFAPIPKTIWMTSEFARLAVSLGHVALVNLLVKAAAGRSLLAPLKAAGKMAFTLYFLEQVIGVYVMFSPIGLHLPGGQGWATLAWQATAIVAILLVFANVWMRFFVSGPLEWLWRSLSYLSFQPFRRRPEPVVQAE